MRPTVGVVASVSGKGIDLDAVGLIRFMLMVSWLTSEPLLNVKLLASLF